MNLAARTKLFLLLIGDAATLYAGLFLTLIIRYGDGFYSQFTAAHAAPFTVVFALWLLIFYISGLYDLRRLRNSLDFLKTLFLSIGTNAVVAVLVFYVVPAFGIAPKTNLLIFIVIFAVLEVLWRRAFNRIFSSGEAPNKVLVVGNSETAREVVAAMRANPQLGYDVKREMREEEAYASPAALIKAAESEGVNLIVVPEHLKHEPRLVTTLYELFGSGITVTDLATLYETIMRKVPLADLEEAWFLENIAAGAKFYDPLKRALELVLAVALGIVLLPIEIAIALIVRITSPGPAIYRQVRVGERGRAFTLYKFRSMRPDSEKHGPQWATENDRRATPFGNFLRKSHLDELPQLWNIAKGEISFVGPRPERPEFVKTLEEKIPYYEVRLLIKPGVTGWAQINYPHDKTTEDVMQKLQYDIYYIKNRSLILDCAIMIRTLKSFIINPKETS